MKQFIPLVALTILVVTSLCSCNNSSCPDTCIQQIEWVHYNTVIDGENLGTHPTTRRVMAVNGDRADRYTWAGKMRFLTEGDVQNVCGKKTIRFRYDGTDTWDEYTYRCNMRYLVLSKTSEGQQYESWYAVPGIHD